MKWISPALMLALLPAGAVFGQSTSSDFGNLAPGPIAELLPDSPSGSSFRPGIIQPPASNPLPVGNATGSNPLPTSGRSTATSPRGSLIKEPVPYNQVPQIQQDIYSLEDTFTLPRTPAVSPDYAQQHPKRFTPPAVGTYSTEMIAPVHQQTMPTYSSPSVATDVCGCGSNEMAPESYQCDTCQGQTGHTDFGSECSTCDEVIVDSCDSCNECTDSSCDDCEIIGGPEAYANTNQCGFADADDLSRREIKHGPIASHFKKHHQKKNSRRQQDDYDSVCGTDACDVGACDVGGCDVGGCDSDYDVYQPAITDTRNPNDTQTNTLFNVSGVYFRRNTPDFLLSAQRNPTGGIPTQFLSTGDADPSDFGGFDATITRRRATGKGFELRYLNLSPGEATASLVGSPFTLLNDFGQIGQDNGLTHQQAYNLADIHEVSRDMSIQNAEFNLLRMGRQAQTRRGQQATFEYLLGFRYFKFEETLAYSASGIRPNTRNGGDITRADFVSDVENELYGAQFGGRSEISLFKRFSLLAGLKAGIFQNNVRSRQEASTTGFGGEKRIAQVLNDPNQGTPFSFSGEDKDYTLLGELDLGLTYRVTNSIRMRGGYKAIFVDDIAFADNQGSSDFSDIAANSTPSVNDDLVLYGGYFGLDIAF